MVGGVRWQSGRHGNASLCPHTFLRTQIRNVLRMWHQNQGSIVFLVFCQKTKIAKYALWNKIMRVLCRRRIGEAVPRPEKLVTWLHRITEISVKECVNLGAIISVLLRYKIWLLSANNRIRATQNSLRTREITFTTICRYDRQTKRHFSSSSLYFGNLVKISPGIVVHQHLTFPRQLVLQSKQYAGWTEHPWYFRDPVWMKSDGPSPWTLNIFHENIKDLLLGGKTPYERLCGYAQTYTNTDLMWVAQGRQRSRLVFLKNKPSSSMRNESRSPLFDPFLDFPLQ